jgi:hypothetical protein
VADAAAGLGTGHLKRLRESLPPKLARVLSEGVSGSRFKLGIWLVAEDRDTAFDGSDEVANPLQERTRIVVPLVMFDMRITER